MYLCACVSMHICNYVPMHIVHRCLCIARWWFIPVLVTFTHMNSYEPIWAYTVEGEKEREGARERERERERGERERERETKDEASPANGMEVHRCRRRKARLLPERCVSNMLYVYVCMYTCVYIYIYIYTHVNVQCLQTRCLNICLGQSLLPNVHLCMCTSAAALRPIRKARTWALAGSTQAESCFDPISTKPIIQWNVDLTIWGFRIRWFVRWKPVLTTFETKHGTTDGVNVMGWGETLSNSHGFCVWNNSYSGGYEQNRTPSFDSSSTLTCRPGDAVGPESRLRRGRGPGRHADRLIWYDILCYNMI